MKGNEITDPGINATYERREQIARTLEEHPRLSVQDLSELFLVSAVTIRKDLTWLQERKLIVRTHGGAILARSIYAEPAFDIRRQLQRVEKDRIGLLAARLVRDGDSIAIDSSTTALALTRHLLNRQELSIVTNGVRASMELAGYPGISVLTPGGMLRRESFSLVGSWGTPVLQRINIQTAFVGARGLTLSEGLTEVSSEEMTFKRALVEAAHEVVALVDHTKWGQVAFATFCEVERLKMVITDDKAPAQMIEQLRNANVQVWIAET
ncbi:DeoR/GlpR family DNA-binding transcription regulator [Dictyobacter formicarum]|uniref:DeoR family transcriptional regulator n=1 Tax=Dictyobacter formicarum TaxID=2778368 RepID=A0ABQ3VCD8_9CHLR|nr:DeoR/GlpR family DNA-binding transcription regulator [Dictyobacter formicarum]GHO83460.1 DeoR family transcriptional regulator [Dictyobacter formicarum]